MAATVPRLVAASPFLRRTLIARGFDLETLGPEGSGPAVQWLDELAGRPWTAERVRADYLLHLERLARAGGAPLEGPGENEVALALRRTRYRLLCGMLVRDASGLADLEEVTGAMTALAELAVTALLDAIAPEMAARFGTPVDAAGEPVDLLVLAMGKAGTGELNVSSDLDLIFVSGEAAQCRRAPGAGPPAPSGPRIDGQEFFDRLGRRLIGALQDAGAEGFVFRVDVRLRPHGDSGPLVVSLGMLEEYLLREGREWERFAWAKARVISRAVLASTAAFAAQRAALEAVVEPFVYRKYFDFGAIGAIRDLHRRIGAEARRSAARRPSAPAPAGQSPDVKLGRGGIREIEFLAQTYCIMRGGRDRRLRERGTVATLRTLAALELLPEQEAHRLIEDYRFLRRLEHALQYRDDAQTHRIPAQPREQEDVACLLGMGSAQELLARYRRVSEEVARSFDGMFPPQAQPGREDASAAARAEAAPAAFPVSEEAMRGLGFADPAASAQRLRQLFESTRLSALSPAARAGVAGLAAQAVALVGAVAAEGRAQSGVGPDELLLRWIRLIEVIGRRSTYFALLTEFPRAHERVVRLLAAGGWPTEYLLRHPILLDELIDPRPERFQDGRSLDDVEPMPGAAEPFWKPWTEQTEAQLLAAEGDVERQMNILRDAHHAQVFRLLLADLGGALQLEHLADHLSALADAVLGLALRAAWRSLAAARGESPGELPRLAIVAYGKLGGRELGYASDLDLAFVFDEGSDPAQAERNATLCTQLVRRLLTWLTSVTSSGILFDIDLRLRPNGDAGLLVTPIDAFERYQANADGHGAWVWEHQALTRARGCAGDRALCERVEAIRAQVLRQARDPAALAAEVVDMRRRMLEGHANRSGRFDLKHDRGGMVDIEFAVQALVLAHAHRHAELLANRGNIGLLGIAARLGLVDAELARRCAAAYRRYRQLQHALRLNGASQARVEREAVRDEIAAVERLWSVVLGTDEPRAPAARAAGTGPDPGSR